MLDKRRFIPTCVGFIGCPVSILSPHTVHPHVRGVYKRLENGAAFNKRFIPTCVGFIPESDFLAW